MNAKIIRVSRKRKYYGEEAEQLTPAEWAAHKERLAQMEAGTYDFSSILVEAPRTVIAKVLP